MADELKQLASFTCDFRLEDADAQTIDKTRYCLLDSIGSAVGASGSEEIRRIADMYMHWSGAGDNGLSSGLWGLGRRANLFTALMVDGLMSHELELDDVHTASKSHVGAVVVPAAWCTADALSADGRSLLEAVIVGYEVMGRVGKAMDVASNRRRGWHTTGIIGGFGAAAAAAKLLRLTPQQTLCAFGMAGTQAAGLWAFLAEGSSCKKLHPARAVVNGVSACLLAQSGMTGPAHILDAEDGGLYAAVSDSFDMSRLVAGLGDGYEICHIDKKPYPCCRTTHHAIDAALKLRDEIDVADIDSILVETYDVGVLQCGFSKYPESTREAKFSIPYTCAAAFVRGRVTNGEFTGETLADPEVMRLAHATRVVADELFTSRYPKRWGSRMTVTLRDGSRHVCQIDDMSGSTAVPLSPRQEIDKFTGLAEPALGCERTRALAEDILRIDTLPRLPEI